MRKGVIYVLEQTKSIHWINLDINPWLIISLQEEIQNLSWLAFAQFDSVDFSKLLLAFRSVICYGKWFNLCV